MTALYHPRPERWPQVSLKGLFVLLTVLGVFLPWVASGVHMVRQRKVLLDNATYTTVRGQEPLNYSGLPLLWRWLGAEPLKMIMLGPQTPDDRYEAIRVAYPEAVVTRQ